MLVIACSPPEKAEAPVDLAQKAEELARTSIIVDGHVDVPYRLIEKWDDVSLSTADGDFDYLRAITGGLNAPFMSIYIPAENETEAAREVADKLIGLVNRIVDDSPDKFAIPFSTDDVRQQFSAGLISLPMGLENGSPPTLKWCSTSMTAAYVTSRLRIVFQIRFLIRPMTTTSSGTV
jgi:membrane dipeptidase